MIALKCETDCSFYSYDHTLHFSLLSYVYICLYMSVCMCVRRMIERVRTDYKKYGQFLHRIETTISPLVQKAV